MPGKYLALPIVLCLLFSGVCVGGCDREEALPQGVVALVNGEPVTLRTVQALQDSRSTGLGASQRPSVQLLRTQYGGALSTLIVHALVMQELERLQLSVRDAAVREAEEQLRQDYPDDEFEKMLTEEYIDLELWRELLRHSLSMKTFEAKVLRPSLSVPLSEVEAYYAAYKAEFHIPARVALVQVHGSEKERVERAKAEYPASLKALPDDMTAQHYTIRRDSVPQDWQKAVYALKPGQATPIRENGGGFQFVVLETAYPAKTLTIAEAYPIIEKLLLEEKMDDAFDAWLKKALTSATVRVSTHLMSELGGAAKTPISAP